MLYLVLLLLAVSIACDRRPQAFGVYAPDTRELVRIDYDSNGDGVIDARTYQRVGDLSASEDLLEVDIGATGVVAVGNQFGVGRQTSP